MGMNQQLEETTPNPVPVLPTPLRPARTWRYHLGTGLIGVGVLVLLGAWVALITAPGRAGSAADALPTPRPTIPPPPRVSVAALKAGYDNPATRPVILDVRPASDYADGHIAGALSLPADTVEALVKTVPRDKPVVLYCQCPDEGESIGVAEKLYSDYGYSYTNLTVLQGGWSAWTAAGYPVTKGDTP
jgi:rhodanese-related sulfurtransferase